MKKLISIVFFSLFLFSCASKGVGTFGRGVSITFDPRTVGMQIDDTIMQKNLIARLTLTEKKYFLSIQVEVLDGRIFVTGKVDKAEEKIKITKMAWETKGVRSVKNALEIRGKSNFKSSAKDILETSTRIGNTLNLSGIKIKESCLKKPKDNFKVRVIFMQKRNFLKQS